MDSLPGAKLGIAIYSTVDLPERAQVILSLVPHDDTEE